MWRTLQELCEFSSFCHGALLAEGGGDVMSSYDAKDTLYQSVTMVGTLLLQMGEVGQRLKNRLVAHL